MCANIKYLRYLAIFLLFFSFVPTQTSAQFRNEEIHERILAQFGVDTLILLEKHFSNIEKATEMQKDADKITAKINDLKKDKKPKRNRISALTIKALQDMIHITRIYEVSFQEVFKLYTGRLTEYPLDDIDKFTKANELIVEGMEMSEKQIGDLSMLTYDDADTTIFRVIKTANEARFLTLYKFQDAFCVYIDCPDLEEETQYPDSFQIFEKEPAIVEKEEEIVAENFTESSPAFAEEDSLKLDNSWDWLNDPVDTATWNYYEARNDFIIFRVQIIAVSKPLSEERLKEIYSGYADVYTEKSEYGLYEYWVGSFFTYNEALKFCNLYGNNSFIVAFKGNKRMNIRQAIEETMLNIESNAESVDETKSD